MECLFPGFLISFYGRQLLLDTGVLLTHRCLILGLEGHLIYELLQNSEAIQAQVIKKAPASVIGQLARSEGMKTLREYGWGRALAGVTSIEEVLRVTQVSENVAEPVENF